MAPAPSPALVLRAKRVIVRPGKVLENASVLVENGRIVAVGAELTVPENAQVVEGEVVCAGFIDAWSNWAIDPEALVDDRANAATLSKDALERYADRRPLLDILRAGVTGVRTQAGAQARMGGLGSFLRLHPTRPLEEVVLLEDCCLAATTGVTRGGRGQDIFERMSEIDRLIADLNQGNSYLIAKNEYKHELAAWQKKIAQKQKELEDGFKKAKKDREKEEADAKTKGKEFKEKEYKEDNKPAPPKFEEEGEVLARAVSGQVPLVVEAHRNAELRALLEGTKAFPRLRLVIAGGSDALTVAQELVERAIPVLIWPVTSAPSLDNSADRPLEFRSADLGLAARLAEAGVEVLLGSGGANSTGSRDLPLLAALAIGNGLDRQTAFQALTLGAARAIDVADRLGTVEVGKDADILVLDGEPLSTTTRVRHVVVGGDLVWSAQ